jgi:hypothetical protein
MRDLNFSHCFRNYIVANFELVEYIETYEIAVSGVIADMYRITVSVTDLRKYDKKKHMSQMK